METNIIIKMTILSLTCSIREENDGLEHNMKGNYGFYSSM